MGIKHLLHKKIIHKFGYIVKVRRKVKFENAKAGRKKGGGELIYLYPKNLRATANLWLWSLKDFAILSIAALVSAFMLVQGGVLLPGALTLGFGFLTIRLDDITVVDFIQYAVGFFLTTEQTFYWR